MERNRKLVFLGNLMKDKLHGPCHGPCIRCGKSYTSASGLRNHVCKPKPLMVIPPNAASQIASDRIFSCPARMIYTKKNKDDEDLKAKARMVMPGHVDPDGEVTVEEGGFRTDAPTCNPVAFNYLMSLSVRRKWRIKSFDVSNAFLSGKAQQRDICVKPPREGLPGVETGSLL